MTSTYYPVCFLLFVFFKLCNWGEEKTKTEHYLVFNTLHHGSTLRNHITGHLLASLGYCANLELHLFSFLQTIRLVCHTHDSKWIILHFWSAWKLKGEESILLSTNKLFYMCSHNGIPTFLWELNKSLVFSLGGVNTAYRTDNFPCHHCPTNIFTNSIHYDGKAVDFICNHSYLQNVKHYKCTKNNWKWITDTCSNLGDLFSTDFVSFSLWEIVFHCVSQIQVIQVSAHFTKNKSTSLRIWY